MISIELKQLLLSALIAACAIITSNLQADANLIIAEAAPGTWARVL